jgi:hypothetical protein
VRYLKWTEKDGELNGGLVELWTEVGEDGYVTREIGFDVNGQVAHKMPSDRYREGTYGLFDLAPIELQGRKDDISAEQFEKRWQESEP